MKEIIETLESNLADIKYDITQEWNNEKEYNLFQATLLAQAIGLLKQVGENNNIKP